MNVAENFTLPSVDFSPFNPSAPTMVSPPVIPQETSTNQAMMPELSAQRMDGTPSNSSTESRPLTPPPSLPAADALDGDSPHRLPSFDFGDMRIEGFAKSPSSPVKANFELPRPASPTKASLSRQSVSSPIKVIVQKTYPSASVSAADVPLPITPAKTTDAVSKDLTNSGGEKPPARVRQRLSRELIRETTERRMADGSLHLKRSSMDVLSALEDRLMNAVELKRISADALLQSQATFELKSHEKPTANHDKSLPATPNETPVLNSSPFVRQEQQAARLRSQTVSNQGTSLQEPQSGLDRLAAAFTPSSSDEQSSDAVDKEALLPKPVGILKQKTDPANIPGSSSGVRRPRRSLSVGEDTPRRPRLTLGLDADGGSVLDAFRDELGNIGSEVRRNAYN